MQSRDAGIGIIRRRLSDAADVVFLYSVTRRRCGDGPAAIMQEARVTVRIERQGGCVYRPPQRQTFMDSIIGLYTNVRATDLIGFIEPVKHR